MAVCENCNSRVLFGGEKLRGMTFCNNDCVQGFKIKLAEQAVTPADLEKHVADAYHSDCPQCRKPGPLDVYGFSKITSYVIVYQISSYQQLSCPGCARSSRFKAAAHTLFLGIWSPKGLLFSVVSAPYTFISGLLTRTPTAPSSALAKVVKATIGERLLNSLPRRTT